MRQKWVDNSAYMGPDRRRVSTGRRWKERRHADEAGDPPALGALLRRIRVAMLSLQEKANRDRALLLTRAAADSAERLQFAACAAKVREAGRLIAVVDAKDLRAVARADAMIVEAMALIP
ncbi:MAG TPA: hypothetical protein VG943_16460 [Caulobacterales bacterium]|nr:hypothetical protein [Caulobacterales bacterium]